MRILVVLATLTWAAAANAQTLSGTETQVTNAAADQFDPAIASDLVVYTDFSGVDADVWYTDLTTGLPHAVSTAPGDQQLTGVSDRRIVFTDWNTMDVLVFDVATGTTTNLTNAAGSNSLDPAISGTLVAWTDDRHGNAEIYARDVQTGVERRITNDLLVDQSPAVGGSLIVWERCDGYACDIFAYDWTTGLTRQLTETPYAAERFPDVNGGIVVFQREQGTPVDKDLVALDLDGGGEKVLALAGDQENPHISGDYVAFNDSASGVPHIGLWNVATGWRFQVTSGSSGQYLNDLDGNRIVYSDNRAGTLDIWMYTFKVEVPNPTLPTHCDDLGAAVPLFDKVYTREKGKPAVFVDTFNAATLGPALICIDNPAAGAPKVHSGWVFFNRHLEVAPWGWYPDQIERHADLKAENLVRVTLASKPGSAIRMRVFAAAVEEDDDDHGCNHPKVATRKLYDGEETEIEETGCSQSGGSLAPWAVALLALFALVPRPTRLAVRSRRR